MLFFYIFSVLQTSDYYSFSLICFFKGRLPPRVSLLELTLKDSDLNAHINKAQQEELKNEQYQTDEKIDAKEVIQNNEQSEKTQKHYSHSHTHHHHRNHSKDHSAKESESEGSNSSAGDSSPT